MNAMGKGSRTRAARANERPAYELPLAQADKLESTVRVLCILAVIVTVLALFLPFWSVRVIADNLAADAYTAEEAAALTRVVPLGRLSLILIPLSTAVTCIMLWLRRSVLSLIGLVAEFVAAAMLIVLAVTLGEVFTFNPILHSGHGQGLSFWDLVLRYYILLLPILMQIVAVCVSFVAHKKRDVADVMKQASDTGSTLTLDEEETTQSAP